MKQLFVIFLFISISTASIAQYDRSREIRLIAGASLPELFSIGGNIKITKLNVVGGSLGFLPVGGLLWQTVNAEHRLYFSRSTKGDIIRKYYFRQGLTFTMPSNEISAFASIGVDRELNQNNDGLSFEAGVYYIFGNDDPFLGDTKIKVRPALAIKYYLKYSKRLLTRRKYKNCNAFK
jgi:hypothetical protein